MSPQPGRSEPSAPTPIPSRRWDWVDTREAYTDWVAEWGARSGIRDAWVWRGFSLWWSSNLVRKDVEVEKEWFEVLHRRLRDRSEPPPAYRSRGRYWRTVLPRFLFDVLKLVYVRLAFGRPSAPRGRVWFHALSSNLRSEDGVTCDRHFSAAPLRDAMHRQRAAFAVRLIIAPIDLVRPWRWRRRMASLFAGIGRDVAILNGFLTLRDVVSVYWTVLRAWTQFNRLASTPAFRQGFTIDGVDCHALLLAEFERSFLGPMQDDLVYSAMFRRWLERGCAHEPQTIVTYGEMLGPIRPVYHQAKRVDERHRFVAVQHSINSRNKLAFYHRGVEFSGGVPHASPFPDAYLVQGEQYARILADFYPRERTRIIGCLKYDRYAELARNPAQIATECRAAIGDDGRRVMLLAPSVNDLSELLDLFESRELPAGWRVILSPHPAIGAEQIRAMIAARGITTRIEMFGQLDTLRLLTIADLVVCGYSAVALEAAIFRVPAARVATDRALPLFEDEPGIPSFHSTAGFWRWFEEWSVVRHRSDAAAATRSLLTDYFFKIDGASADRLWAAITDAGGASEASEGRGRR
jgi:hypothetical protein